MEWNEGMKWRQFWREIMKRFPEINAKDEWSISKWKREEEMAKKVRGGGGN